MFPSITTIKSKRMYRELKKRCTHLIPCLVFENTKEALEYYGDTFGATDIVRIPLREDQTIDFEVSIKEISNKTIHSQFKVLGITIMAADSFAKDSSFLKNFPILLDIKLEKNESMAKIKEFWDGIIDSDGIIIKIPLERHSRKNFRGSFIDTYGIYWILNVEASHHTWKSE